jgi:endonuclease/exonuclease/phosphatase family metal-dependent hydrolase
MGSEQTSNSAYFCPMSKSTIIKIGLAILSVFLLYIVAILAYGTLNDWQPQGRTALENQGADAPKVIEDSTLSLVSWNLGYGGLGEESEFFFDHGNMYLSMGRMVRAPEEAVRKNNEGIFLHVSSIKSDFFLFQEVDYQSKRSYYTNQHDSIRNRLPAYTAYFAPNYRSPLVPIPVFEPWHFYGSVESGLGTYSRFQPYASERVQLPGSFGWPVRLFLLDRCVAVHRFRVKGGKELVVMNVHNSAYDADGSLKKEQMKFLRELFMQEYEQGHYVIVGGDWNQVPPYFRFDGFMPGNTQGYTQTNISPEFLPSDWQWAYDPRLPTNRKIKTPYEPGKSFITLIDFFLLSPNVRLLKAKGIDQQFRFSDHHPVYVEVELLDN